MTTEATPRQRTNGSNGTTAHVGDVPVIELDTRPVIDVDNAAVAVEWLREEMGRGPLSGVFARGESLVHSPYEAEAGYVAAHGGHGDGPAAVRRLTADYLLAQLHRLYRPVRPARRANGQVQKLKGQAATRPAMFPRDAARLTAATPAEAFPNLRRLSGVVHAPVFRGDGTILDQPGYDAETRLLHLPDPTMRIPPVADEPTADDAAAAVALLGRMLEGFPFLSDHFRANYIGAMLTPLLRTIAPPAYKLVAIEAHQPGSGKTLLASLIRTVHGGLFRSEMPSGDDELRKQITSILSQSTGSVVVIDNVTGLLASSTLAGLLTSATWDDRPLGSTEVVHCDNDRLWVVTGNNIQIGGDLPRRTIRVVIDPGCPDPHLRTGFAIGDLAGWVATHRGDVLHALLTLVRYWVVEGMPVKDLTGSDSYATWTQVVRGVLETAGVAGQFDHPSTRVEVADDDQEWRRFLLHTWAALGSRSWTAAEMLAHVGGLTQPEIPVDALPGNLAERAERSGPKALSRSLGQWLKNRNGRWVGDITVRHVDTDRTNTKVWKLVRKD